MINALASRIWRHDTFHAEYRSLLRANLAMSLGVGDASDGLSDAAIWRLLQSATHLSGVTEIPEGSAMRAAAYRIAVSAWRLYRQRFDNLGKVLHFVLGRLGNFPAIGYLSQTQDDDRRIALPAPLWLEVTAHAIENRVEVTQTESITLTDFQRRLWMALEAGTPTAVTAPTSSGKSFVLQHFLVAAVLGAPGQWGLYVVPTRALITQVSSELMRLFKDLAPEREVQVLTIPLPPETLGVSNGVYVLTQERTQILIESGIELPFRLAIIDEAHNLGEGARGIVLQTVIEKLQRNEQGVRFLFGCPQTGNLQVLQRVFAFDQLEPITERDSPVAQNLIFLNTNSKDPAQVSVGAIIDGETTHIGTLNIGVSVVGKPEQRLATVSWAVGKHDQNLVYVGGPAKCEVVSDLLRQFAVSEGNGSVNVDVHQRREEFAEFLREHIHPQYLLADTVLAGVGFHYGNMPSTVRKTLEEYFASGDLSYLACTTTLLAGVNLPAKNLFLMDPTKGSEFENRKEQAISATDFWNLAGRAGRLGKDFEGNVFLIDHARWRADPLAGPREQELASAVEETIVTRGNDFLQFVRNHEHPSGREPAFENTFVKLVNHARRGELTDQLSRVFRDTKPSLRAEIHRVIEEAAERAEIPREVAERNINVSIYRQDEMLRHLVEKIQREGPESVIPIHPLIGAAYNSLLGVFGRIAVYFEHNSARSYVYFTRLALQWMRGSSLARLIADAYSYDASHRSRGVPNVSTVIRRVMREIERDLRFRYVKYTNCYNDLLREALDRTGYEHEATSLPMLPLYLELGASSDTMVSLIGLGLTRTTAGVIADRAFRSDMDRADAERWLRQQPWESTGISPICVREIRQLLS